MRRLSASPRPDQTEHAVEAAELELSSVAKSFSDLLTNKADKKAVADLKAITEKLSSALNGVLSQLKALDQSLQASGEEVGAVKARIETLVGQIQSADNLAQSLNLFKRRIADLERLNNRSELQAQLSALNGQANEIKETIEKVQRDIKNLKRRPSRGGAGVDAGVFNDHSARHENAGDDVISIEGLAGAPAQKAAASGLASLDGSSKVVQDPANATATVTASKIPIADGSGKLDDWVSASSTTVSGKTEAAIASEVNTGTDEARAVTPDALAGSSIFGVKPVGVIVIDPTTDVTVGDGKAYIPVPACYNGMNLIRAQAIVITAGTTNATTIAIYNVTDSQEMLSTNISIASGATVGTVGVINATYDDVATNDVLRIDVDAVSTTKPKGLLVVMEFQLP